MPKAKGDMLSRRPDIVSTAQSIFHQRGYDATSIQEIAEAVGLLKGSLYHYIDAKDDLLFAIVERVHSEMNAQWQDVDPGPDDSVARLRSFVQAHVTYITRDLEGVAVFLTEFRSLGPERRREIVRRRDAYESLLGELIAAATSSTPDDQQVQLQSYSIFGMMNWVAQWYRPDGALHGEDVAESIADMALQMLGLAQPAPVAVD